MKKIIKSTSTVMIASTLAVSSLHVTPALAAESYKIKSGKLVNAKTNKVVKGYKLYKNVLYKDGKRTTGNVVYKNVLYSNGKKATGTKLYKKVLYVAGKKSTGYKTYKSVLYYKGTTFTGTRGTKYYKSGKVYTGFRTINAQKVYYKSGVRYTGVYKNNFYLDGLPNAGYTVHKDILYKDTQVATGLIYYGDRLYVNGKLGNGTFDFNGKMTLFINGVVQKDVTVGGDTGTNPGSESAPPGTTTPGGGTNTGGSTNTGGGSSPGGSIIIIGDSQNSGGNANTGGGTNSGGSTTPGGNINNGGNTTPGGNTNTDGNTKPGTDTNTGGGTKPGGDTNTEDGKKPSDGGTTDTVTVINKTEVYKEVSAANIADIQAIVDAYNKLSAADKKKVTYPINDVAQLITVYKLNQSKISTVTAQNLDEARELIAAYNDLTAANKKLVKLDIKGLEAAIAHYLENLKLSAEEINKKPTFNEITLSNYEQAATILAAYEQLSKAEQAKVTYPIAALKQLLDVYKLNTTAMPLVDASTISLAKNLVAIYESLGSYQSKVTFDIAALKKAIEQYDNPTLLSIDKINKQTVINEVTAANIDTAREIINSFNQLSQTDQAKVTYPVATLKKLVDVYTLNSANFTTVTASTLARAKELVALYESLGSYQSQVTKFDIVKIKKEIELFENPSLIPIEDLNKQPVISEVTPQNLADAQAIVAAYDKLSSADQKKVTYPAENVRALLKVYEINLVTWTEVTAENLEQTEAAIKLYGQLDSAHYTKVKVNINDLKNVVTAYKFVKDYIGKDISVYEIAVGFMANYNVLDNNVKQLVKNKLNVSAALATIEATNLQNEITALKAEIGTFTTAGSINEGNVKDAKRLLQKALNADSSIRSKLETDITGLKEKIASYDFINYGKTVIYKAKMSALYSQAGPANLAITTASKQRKAQILDFTRKETFYWLRMFEASDAATKDAYLTSSIPGYATLNVRDVINNVYFLFDNGVTAHYISSNSFNSSEFNKIASDISYNFEEEYVYQTSLTFPQ